MFNWQKDLDVENREYLIGALNAAPWLSGSIMYARNQTITL